MFDFDCHSMAEETIQTTLKKNQNLCVMVYRVELQWYAFNDVTIYQQIKIVNYGIYFIQNFFWYIQKKTTSNVR